MFPQVALGMLLLIAPVTGLGTNGHRIVANLAWKLISDHTKNEIQDLLLDKLLLHWSQMSTTCGDCTPLGKVAEWADDMKKVRGEDWLIHSIFADCEADPLGYSRNRTYSDDDVIGSIVQVSTDLVDQRQTRQRRELFLPEWELWFDKLFDSAFGGGPKESLMALVHLVGDIHTPLHCGCSPAERDSVLIQFFDCYYRDALVFPATPFLCEIFDAIWPVFASIATFIGCRWPVGLHSVWDFCFIEKSLEDDFEGSRNKMEDDLWHEFVENNDQQRDAWLSCFPGNTQSTINAQQVQDCAVEWANESLEYARQFAYHDEHGKEIVENGTVISGEYYRLALPVLRKRLASGGVRLAALLDRLFWTE